MSDFYFRSFFSPKGIRAVDLEHFFQKRLCLVFSTFFLVCKAQGIIKVGVILEDAALHSFLPLGNSSINISFIEFKKDKGGARPGLFGRNVQNSGKPVPRLLFLADFVALGASGVKLIDEAHLLTNEVYFVGGIKLIW